MQGILFSIKLLVNQNEFDDVIIIMHLAAAIRSYYENWATIRAIAQSYRLQ